jgi:hypothetical protein
MKNLRIIKVMKIIKPNGDYSALNCTIQNIFL